MHMRDRRQGGKGMGKQHYQPDFQWKGNKGFKGGNKGSSKGNSNSVGGSQQPSADGFRPKLKAGDWTCSSCKGHNYVGRLYCYQCKHLRLDDEVTSQVAAVEKARTAVKDQKFEINDLSGRIEALTHDRDGAIEELNRLGIMLFHIPRCLVAWLNLGS